MDSLFDLDKIILHFVNVEATHPWLDVFFAGITDLHKNLFFNLIAYPLFLGLFYWKFKARGFLVFFGLLLCLGFSDGFGNLALKKTVQRPRPGDTPGVEVITRTPYGGYSFTSNHATNMFALATYSSRFVPQLTIPVYSVAFLVSYSRVYNGVHFPSDVVVGGMLGTIWGLLFSWLFTKFLRRQRNV